MWFVAAAFVLYLVLHRKPGKLMKTLTGVRMTNYHIVQCEPGDVPIYDKSGTQIDTISADSLSALTMEGTGDTPNGQRVNYAGRNVWQIIPKTQYGLGVGNRPLVPFKSIAVDPNVIPIGCVCYCLETSAWYEAVDIGDLIQGNHIDLFTGTDQHPAGLPDWVSLKVYC